jgi:hypothetical protein
VSLIAGDPGAPSAAVNAAVLGPISLVGGLPPAVGLDQGRGRFLVPLVATGDVGTITLGLASEVDGFTDRVRQSFEVVPRGFPHHVSRSGLVRDSVEFSVGVPGSLRTDLTLYPARLSRLDVGRLAVDRDDRADPHFSRWSNDSSRSGSPPLTIAPDRA